MSHPTELLAAYVDGSLSEEERDRVEAHLATCRTCRQEVELARAVVPALAALEEEPVPVGVTRPVLEKAGERTDRSWSAEWRVPSRSSRWTKVSVALGGVAAASIAIVLAITLSGGSGGLFTAGPAGGGAGSASAPSNEAAPAHVRLEKQDRNYDETSLRRLADASARPSLDTAAALPAASSVKYAFSAAQ
ncbi:MAG TPA: zf-HC2 domain-containing protein, partial [Actinomycetota bacterium]|nr:zf-HC2 domain-containing protein [Actinomycetota bacterium]